MLQKERMVNFNVLSEISLVNQFSFKVQTSDVVFTDHFAYLIGCVILYILEINHVLKYRKYLTLLRS